MRILLATAAVMLVMPFTIGCDSRPAPPPPEAVKQATENPSASLPGSPYPDDPNKPK